MAVFAGGGSRLVTVGFRPRVVGLPLLAAEAAVGAVSEADTLVGLDLASGEDGVASFCNSVVLGEDGTGRAVAVPCTLKEVGLGSFGDVGGIFARSDVETFFADSATAIGLAPEPRVIGFPILGDTTDLGVRGEVGDFGEGFVGGTCLLGGGLMGFISLVVLSLVEGGGRLWFEETASLILLPIVGLDSDPGVGLAFDFIDGKSVLCGIGDFGGSLALVACSLDGGEASKSDPFKIPPRPQGVESSAFDCSV